MPAAARLGNQPLKTSFLLAPASPRQASYIMWI